MQRVSVKRILTLSELNKKSYKHQRRLTIQAGVGGAVVNFLFTIKASVSHWALAEVTTFWVVTTAATIKARSICAGVGT